MKHSKLLRALALALCLALCLSLLAVPAFAEDEIWIEEPTGWQNWGHVQYETETVNYTQITKNWGVRGEQCRFRSKYALEYYNTDEGENNSTAWYYNMTDLAGGTGTGDALDSPLYTALHQFLVENHVHKTNYQETRDYYRLTDCMANNSDYVSSFYSGRKLNGAWDGTTWNREHTWPNSKSTGQQEDDIMMLRPTSMNENSSRGNKAYGESSGYYDPNAESEGRFDLRGDCARICLYCYVRYPENAGNMWGQSGVMESLDLLLDWMEQDPVDTWEMGRNDAVETITGLRNVFVDFPELAWALFGQAVPEDYPTPFKGDHNDFVSAPAYLEALPDDPAHGSVTVEGWAVACNPSEGYYASGFELYTVNGDHIFPEGHLYDLFHWAQDRLIYTPETEADFLVIIHFTPIGETDPCPAGHVLDYDNPSEIIQEPSCTDYGRAVLTCARCGTNRETVLDCLNHDWDEGVLIKAPTIQENGLRLHNCRRCGEIWEEEIYFEFADVSDPEIYYYAPVYWALEHDPRITTGTDATHFTPDRICSRAEVVTFLWRAAGCETPGSTGSFADVEPGSYYETAAAWAVEQGITLGTGDGRFSPDAPCSRAQVVTFLWRAAGKPAPTAQGEAFSDVEAGSYYETAVAWAVEHGVTYGTGSGFSPEAPCSRGQIVTFLYRAPEF